MNLIFEDKKYIWHPYTQALGAPEPLLISRGMGAELYNEKGEAYIDAISSWWVNLHGHCNPHIVKMVQEQTANLEHVLFAGCTHPTAVHLSRRLISILPPNQKKIFFSDNGSTAVEVASKAAIQYWSNRGQTRYQFISFQNAYHGDTFGAMSLSEKGIFTRPFQKNLFQVFSIPIPQKKNRDKVFKSIRKILSEEKIAAFIFEPLVQGVGGMYMYEPEYLNELIQICRLNGVLTVADEVMTGFGRLGRLFGADFLEEKPDIICLSKGLTGGFLPLGVTSFTNQIFEAFLSEDRSKTFFHGHSYTANPISCAAGLGSLDLLEKKSTWDNIHRIDKQHQEFLERIKVHPAVKDVRHRGTILALEISTSASTSYLNEIGKKLYDFYIREKVLLRPLGNIIYILPPYCISQEQLDKVYLVIESSLDTVYESE